MILTITPNPLLDFVIHEAQPPTAGGHRVGHIPYTVGGKGINVARMLKTLGRPGLAVSFAGGPNGEKVRQRLKEQGISAILIPTGAETRAGINVVVNHPPSQMWWIEEGEELTSSECQALFEAVDRECSRTRFLAMSGTIPGKGQTGFYRGLLERCREGTAEIYLDAHGKPLIEALHVGGFFLKHNRDECRESFGLDPLNPLDRQKLMATLREKRVTGALITDGPRACVLIDHVSISIFQPPSVREVSAVGSGDAALAGFIFRRAEGESLIESTRWALAAGAADACHPGPCEATFQEVAALVDKVVLLETIPGGAPLKFRDDQSR
ncbi:MAG: PfkB family carbohydrate kinase [Candidatus Ozemobacteraceae bacterium]